MNEQETETVRLVKFFRSDIDNLRDLRNSISQLVGPTTKYSRFILLNEQVGLIERMSTLVRTYPFSGYRELVKVRKHPAKVDENDKGMTLCSFVDEYVFEKLADLEAACYNLQIDNETDGVGDKRYSYAIETLRAEYDGIIQNHILHNDYMYPNDALACFEAAGVKEDGNGK